MRIGIDVIKALAPRDGIGNYTFHLLRALMALDREHEYRLYGLSGPLDAAALDRELPERPENFRAVAGRYPRRGDVDVFHCTTLIFPVTFRGPVVFTSHDLTFLSHPDHHALINKLQATTATLHALLAGATFACVSRATADELHARLAVPEECLAVIHHGADPRFHPLPREETRERLRVRFALDGGYVLSVGTLEPRKNQRRLVAAHGGLPVDVRRRYPLVLAGAEGWKLEEAVGELPDHVRLLGRVSDDELVDLYNGATLFAYPSLAEGFGLPVLEAMACGAPVVTSNVSSLPEVAGDAARLVDPLAVEALGAALGELLGDEAERRRLAERGRARAAGFTWSDAARKTLDLYVRVSSSR